MRRGSAILRARDALPTGEVDARRARGAEALATLRRLADAVAATLPELAALERFATRPVAATLSVGWFARGARLADAARITLTLTPRGLDITWGYGRPAPDRGDRDRRLAEGMRRRRALGESLALRLGALRAEGARLYARHGDDAVIAEEEWLRAPAGIAVFSLPEAALGEGESATRAVAWRVGALAAQVRALGVTRVWVCFRGRASRRHRRSVASGPSQKSWAKRHVHAPGVAPSLAPISSTYGTSARMSCSSRSSGGNHAASTSAGLYSAMASSASRVSTPAPARIPGTATPASARPIGAGRLSAPALARTLILEYKELSLRSAESLESRLAVPSVLFFFLPFLFLILTPLVLPVLDVL